MNTKTFLTSALVVFTVGTLIYCNHNVKFNQTLLTTIPHLEKFPNDAKISSSKIEQPIVRNIHVDAVVAKANPEKPSTKPTDQKAKAEVISTTPESALATEPPEPTSDNADMPATGEFADQINLQIEKVSCEGTCVDSASINLPATGEFSDQINTNEILIAAKNKGLDTIEYQQLKDVAPDSHPTTETGVYTPPGEF